MQHLRQQNSDWGGKAKIKCDVVSRKTVFFPIEEQFLKMKVGFRLHSIALLLKLQ